jgi:hypothetical protein
MVTKGSQRHLRCTQLFREETHQLSTLGRRYLAPFQEGFMSPVNGLIRRLGACGGQAADGFPVIGLRTSAPPAMRRALETPGVSSSNAVSSLIERSGSFIKNNLLKLSSQLSAHD